MINKTVPSRRTFLKTLTVTGAGYMVAAGQQPLFSQSPNERPGVACVGVGGKGGGDCDFVAKYGRIVAICDVDRTTLAGKSKANHCKDAKAYLDYREMLKRHEKDIDIVTVSTPDHMHAAPTLMAMRMGKSCYTQKPLTRTMYEARLLAKVAAETGVCTQMGNQGTALNPSRWTIAQLKAGVIGAIKEIHVWTNRPVWPQTPGRTMTMERFAKEAKAESPENAEKLVNAKKKDIAKQLETVDWDLWLGTAPKREFWPGLYHARSWRGFWDFGTGALGDMACHMMTVPFAACGLKDAVSVKAKTTGHDFDSYPTSSTIEFQFPERDGKPAFKFWWYDRRGNLPPMEIFEKWGIKPEIERSNFAGILIIGEKGALYDPTDDCRLPEFKGDVKLVPDDKLYVHYAVDQGSYDLSHMYEFVEAVNTREPARCVSNFVDRAGPLTETILLGNLAVWASFQGGDQGGMASEWGPEIQWDAASLSVPNLDDITKAYGKPLADKIVGLVTPKYTDGYRLD